MCVIIHRQAGKDVPFEMLKNAVLRNRDGFGLITHLGSGELDVRHEFNPKGNDPEFIQSLMLDAKDYPVSLHLRFSTAGEKSKENCHPFKVGSKDIIGRDVYFFHNGTMSQFQTRTGPSDSNLFAQAIVQHAVKMAVDAYGEDWAKSPSLEQILSYYAGTYSVFTLVDSFEGHMVINRDLGKTFDGWWASNNSYFHAPSTYTYAPATVGGGAKGTANPPKTSGVTNGAKTTSSSVATTPTASTTKPTDLTQCLLPWAEDDGDGETQVTEAALLRREAKKIRSFLELYTGKDGPSNGFIMFKSIGVEKFRELAGIDSLYDLVSLDPDDIDDIVDQFPRMASMLISDLLQELYLSKGQTAAYEEKKNVG